MVWCVVQLLLEKLPYVTLRYITLSIHLMYIRMYNNVQYVYIYKHIYIGIYIIIYIVLHFKHLETYPSGPLLCNHILQQTVDSPSTIHL